MFVDQEFLDIVLRGAVLSVVGLFWVIVLIRMNGLRSLSKMTNFDFVMTVALGSLLAGLSQATEWSGAFQIMVAMAALFATQFSLAWMRQRSDRVEVMLSNRPQILMRNGEFVEEMMRETRVSRSDLMGKLREANVLDLGEVRAVVLEVTGEISVLHGETLSETLLADLGGPVKAG